ncbi:MAG: hypothetical protein ACYS76_12115, partial [Planctomycetota bacterium]
MTVERTDKDYSIHSSSELAKRGTASTSDFRLIDNLEAGQGDKLIVNQFEDPIEPRYGEDASGGGGDAAENESVPTIGQ